MVNRRDFRPYDNRMSTTKSYTPRGSNSDVTQAFAKGKTAKSGTMYSTGDKLYSYGTVIATRQADGRVVLNNTKYSVTTSRQQSLTKKALKDNNVSYDVTGGKERGYEGEDFENTDRIRKSNYDVNSKEYKESQHKISTPSSLKEEKYGDKQMRISQEVYGKQYKDLSSDEQDKIVDIVYKEHGMSVSEVEKYEPKAVRKLKFKEQNKQSYQQEQKSIRESQSKPTGRLTLSEIKSRNSSAGQYFFSPSTMKMYRQVDAKYSVRYDKRTDTNYVVVNMKKYPETSERKTVVYKLNKKNNHLDIQ